MVVRYRWLECPLSVAPTTVNLVHQKKLSPIDNLRVQDPKFLGFSATDATNWLISSPNTLILFGSMLTFLRFDRPAAFTLAISAVMQLDLKAGRHLRV